MSHSWVTEVALKAESFLESLDNHAEEAFRSKKLYTKPRYTSRDAEEMLQRRNTRSKFRPAKLTNRPLAIMQPCQCNNKALPSVELHKTKKLRRKDSQRNFTTKVRDPGMEVFGYKPRRASLSKDLTKFNHSCAATKLKTMEVENAKLKKEVDVAKEEIKELVVRLRKEKEATEKAIKEIRKLECNQLNVSANNGILTEEIQKLQVQISEAHKNDLKLKEQLRALTTEVIGLREQKLDVAKMAIPKQMIQFCNELKKRETFQEHVLQLELRQAQSQIRHLQEEIRKSNDQCKNAEVEWGCHKFRMATIMEAKDKEILALQQGVNLTELNKLLVDEIEKLKQERDELKENMEEMRLTNEQMREYVKLIEQNSSVAENNVQEENNNNQEMKQHVTDFERKFYESESITRALREALSDERAARTRLETTSQTLAKELRTLQDESGKTISRIRCALREKEAQLARAQESSKVSSCYSKTVINVGVDDYDYRQTVVKKQCQLTNKLNQRQTKIDAYMAKDSRLKIKPHKLEEKNKPDMTGAFSIISANVDAHAAVKQVLWSLNDHYAHYSSSIRQAFLTAQSLVQLFMPRKFVKITVLVYVVFLHIWVAYIALFSPTPYN